MFVRLHQFPYLPDQRVRLRLSRFAAPVECFVYFHHQRRELPQPGEMRVSQNERQKSARPGNGTVVLFVRGAFEPE